MKKDLSAKSKNLLVIGGADGIGMWLVRHVFSKAPDIERITLADVKPLYSPDERGSSNPEYKHIDALMSISKPLDAVRLGEKHEIEEWIALDTKGKAPDRELSLKDYGLVMLSVPENQVEKVTLDLLPRLHAGTELFDVTSTKARAINSMLKHSPDGVGVLGMHPLFGPAVPDAIGQTFIIVRTDRTNKKFCDWLISLLRHHGGIVEETDAETHDGYMLLVQTLAHYAYLVFGKTLAHMTADMDLHFGESFRFSTPPYDILTAFTSRIIGGNPRLYAQIQGQTGSDKFRRMFVEKAQELAERFAEAQPETSRLAAIQEIIDPFKSLDVQRAYANSIVLADSVQQSYRDLYRRMKSGELTIVEARPPFEQRAASRVHIGIVEEVDAQNVKIAKRQAIVNGKWHLNYDEESRAAMKKGINVREEFAFIKRQNIRKVFSLEETREWRIANLDHYQRDISVLVDNTVNLNNICKALELLNDSVISGRLLASSDNGAVWLARFGVQNKLLRFTIFGDRNPEKCVRDLKNWLGLFSIKTQTEPFLARTLPTH